MVTLRLQSFGIESTRSKPYLQPSRAHRPGYSHDAWESTPPRAGIAILRKAGLKRALVSSSSDEGTQKLYAEPPGPIRPPTVAVRR